MTEDYVIYVQWRIQGESDHDPCPVLLDFASSTEETNVRYGTGKHIKFSPNRMSTNKVYVNN